MDAAKTVTLTLGGHADVRRTSGGRRPTASVHEALYHEDRAVTSRQTIARRDQPEMSASFIVILRYSTGFSPAFRTPPVTFSRPCSASSTEPCSLDLIRVSGVED